MIVVDLSARATTIHHDHGLRAERPHSITSRRGAGLAELPTADLAVDADDGRSPDEATSRPSKRTPSRRYGSIWRGSRVRGDALRLMPNWQICLPQPSLVLAGRSAEIGGRCESGPCRPVPVGGRARGYSPDVFPQSGGERPDQPLTRPPGNARCASSAQRLTIPTAAPTLCGYSLLREHARTQAIGRQGSLPAKTLIISYKRPGRISASRSCRSLWAAGRRCSHGTRPPWC